LGLRDVRPDNGMDGRFVLEGRAWVFGDQVDADWQICSLDRLAELKDRGTPLTAETLGKYCLETVDPEFPQQVSQGDLLIAGENFGYSSACLDGDPEDPHLIGAASMALKGVGIAAVVCQSANTTFLRNSLHHGLPIVECRDIKGKVREGDILRIDLATGVIVNSSTGDQCLFTPYPPFLLEMVRAGGVYAQLERRAQEGRP